MQKKRQVEKYRYLGNTGTKVMDDNLLYRDACTVEINGYALLTKFRKLNTNYEYVIKRI